MRDDMHNISSFSDGSENLNAGVPLSDASHKERTLPALVDYAKAQSRPVANPCEVGSVLNDRYELLRLLGSGGMGRVFLAVDRKTNKPCAIKLMHAHLSKNQTDLSRFEQEASISISLKHKNIAEVYDGGCTMEGNPFIVMEYIDGKTLADRLDGSRLELSEFFNIFEQICEGVYFAHVHKVVHRDIKPSNIMIVDIDGGTTAKIVDFGIARRCQITGYSRMTTLNKMILKLDRESESLSAVDDDMLQRLTQPGEIFGSPLYMSPEQCEGKEADCRSEVYALGCMMFEALTGSAPLKGRSAMETVMKRVREFAPSLNEALPGLKFPSSVVSLVAGALEREPNDRHQNVEQLLSVLRHVHFSL
jgi:serine/threonine protein kinase